MNQKNKSYAVLFLTIILSVPLIFVLGKITGNIMPQSILQYPGTTILLTVLNELLIILFSVFLLAYSELNKRSLNSVSFRNFSKSLKKQMKKIVKNFGLQLCSLKSFIVLFVFGVALSVVNMFLTILMFSNDTTRDSVSTSTPESFNSDIGYFVIVMIVFIAPLVEEIFFRGFVYTYCEKILSKHDIKKYFKIIIPILVSGVLFGLAHYNGFYSVENIFNFIVHIIFGIVFGVVRWKTGSLFSSFALHCGINSFVMFLTL